MQNAIRLPSGNIEKEFLQQVARLRRTCPELFERTTNSRQLKDLVGARQYHYPINYELDARDFNRAYFFKNFFKCLLAISYLKGNQLITATPTIDLGAGAGTFTLAHVTAFPNLNLNHLLLDRSAEQLALAGKILASPDTHYITGDLNAYPFPDEHLGLFSYSLCEQTLLRNNWPNEMILIDYPEILDKLQTPLSDSYFTARYTITFNLNEQCAQLLEENTITVHILHAKAKKKIIQDYFNIWQTFDSEALRNIFTASAAYSILPRNKILHGLNQIQDYWQRNKLRQHNLRLTHEVINFGNNICTVKFTAMFHDFEERNKQLIDGLIYFHFQFDKIWLLEEFYKQYILK